MAQAPCTYVQSKEVNGNYLAEWRRWARLWFGGCLSVCLSVCL